MARSSLEDEAELFRLLVQSVSDDAILLLDPEGHVASWNQGAQRIKGYTADEVLGKHFEMFYPLPDVRRGKPAYELRVAAEEGRVEDEGWRLRKDGSRFWANVVITALRNSDGELLGFSKITRDITAQRRAQAERERLLKLERTARAQANEAGDALRLRDEFLSIAAHELKTPITSLLGSVQLLARRLDQGQLAQGQLADDARARERVQAIETQARRLGQLVSQLLDVSRVQAGRLILDRRPTDVVEVVRTVVGHLAEQADSPRIVVRGATQAIAVVDPLRIEQVLTNLLSNALKYALNGRPILVDVRRRGTTVRISVREYGPGAPRQRPGGLFDRFYQARAGDQHSGMGLGLYISRQIVEQHRGRIQAEFPRDGGTRLVVVLPVE